MTPLVASKLALSSQQQGWRRELWARIIIWTTGIVTAVPVLIDLALDPVRRPFGYVAADAFYYMSVARNIVTHGSVSMDGVHATNGFHPLWQVVAALDYAVAACSHQTRLAILLLVLTNLAFVVAGVWLLGRAMWHASRSLSVLFLGLPFGLYALLVLPAWLDNYERMATWRGGEGPLPLYGTLFSHVNGMESGLTIFAFALLAAVHVKYAASERVRAGIACGSALALLSLSRLDHVVLAVCPWGLWLSELSENRRRRFAAAALASSALPLLVYLGLNRWYAGMAFPVSGAAKSTFPIPRTETVERIVAYLKSPIEHRDLFELYRSAPEALSLISTLMYLVIVVRFRVGENRVVMELRSFTSRFDKFLVAMSPGIVLLDLYNILFCSGLGHWYFPVTSLCISLTFLSVWTTVLQKWLSRVPLWASLGWLRGIAGVALIVLTIMGFCKLHRQVFYHERYADFCLRVAPRVRAALGTETPRLLEHDDGIVGYCLGAPALSGSGLTLDREAHLALQSGRFFQLAVERGHTALTTFFYGAHDLDSTSSPEKVRQWVRSLMGEIPRGYDAELLYGDGDITLVELLGPDRIKCVDRQGMRQSLQGGGACSGRSPTDAGQMDQPVIHRNTAYPQNIHVRNLKK